MAFATSTTFGQSYDVRISIAGDDREEQLPAGNISNNSDLEMPYEDTGQTTEQVIGLRYQAPIAKGAQVIEAYVEFTVDETKGGTEPVNLIIDGHLTPDAGTLTSSITFNISARSPRTKTQVAWAVPNWTAAGEKSRTADISGILNEIFNQDGWKSGNSLVLIFQDDKSRPSSGVRAADAYEDGATLAPVLHIRVATPLATAPNPADGNPGVGLPLFTWTKGDGAVLHNIYFRTTPDLTAANLVEADYPVEEYYYAPGLEPGITYYWRVDEIDVGGVVKTGAVWSFTTCILVDDFESYTDEVSSRIFQTWIDGWGYTEPPPGDPGNGTGATVGYSSPPFADMTVVHGGLQSMPLDYNNINSPWYSETQREFATAENWQAGDANDLVLYVSGKTANAPASLYVAVEDTSRRVAVVAHPDPNVVNALTWVRWKIPLSKFAGVNLAAVKTLCIGVGDRDAPKAGGAGKLYIDDIIVVTPAPAGP